MCIHAPRSLIRCRREVALSTVWRRSPFIRHPSLAFIHRLSVTQSSYLWSFLKHSDWKMFHFKTNIVNEHKWNSSPHFHFSKAEWVNWIWRGEKIKNKIKPFVWWKLNQSPMSMAIIDWCANFNWLLKSNNKLSLGRGRRVVLKALES